MGNRTNLSASVTFGVANVCIVMGGGSRLCTFGVVTSSIAVAVIFVNQRVGHGASVAELGVLGCEGVGSNSYIVTVLRIAVGITYVCEIMTSHPLISTLCVVANRIAVIVINVGY